MKNKALVIGFGISGRAAAKFLQSKGYAVTAVDAKPKNEVLPDTTSFFPWDFDVVVVSPGISSLHPLVQRAKQEKTEVIGELELGLRSVSQPCVGITGTNGKTTATSLVAHVLGGKALGNIGIPLTEYLLNPNPDEILVIELSSFQLETLKSKAFDLVALLNISPDHLDRYESFEEYAKTKCQIGKFGKTLYLPRSVKEAYYPFLKEYPLHVIEGESVAFHICHHFGVSKEEFQRKASTFQKPPHRLQLIKEVEGIRFYDDSKATNLDSVIFAVSDLGKGIWLLAGGMDKGASYTRWIKPFKGKVRGIIVFGQAADKIYSELHEEFFVDRVQNLKDAVKMAWKKAKIGEKILLSPGCSSYDQFENYVHRGEVFQSIVEGMGYD